MMAALLVLLIFLATSIISIINKEYYIIIIMAFFLLFIGGMFLLIALIEWSSYLEIDPNKIVFHYKVFSKDKGLKGFNRKGLSVDWNDVKLIKIRHMSQDRILSSDTNFVTFFLKDSRIFETTFFHFGKTKEHEILSKIQSYAPKQLVGDTLYI